MPISEKTRKILWARSGNLCAICRQPLVIERVEPDSESVVGEECHIVSRASQGPRHDPTYPDENFDSISNLILLCCTHHKMVDDQFETYSADLLGQIKANHERWVETRLKDSADVPPVRIRRFHQNIPDRLELVRSGRHLLAMGSSCCGMYQHHDDHLSESDVELVGGFLQSSKNAGGISILSKPL